MSWTRFLCRGKWDDERARELESYLEIEAEENVRLGMAPAEARAAARRRLGNPTRIREEIFQMNSIMVLEHFWQDLKHGVRLLRNSPVFASVAVLSIALGIGANTAIFQMLNAVRLRALPVERPQELVEVQIVKTPGGRTGSFVGPNAELTHPLWELIRSQQTTFSSMLAWGSASLNLSPGGEARPVLALWVNGDFFNVLGVRARLGRVFTSSDDRPGCGSPGAVISDAFWQREYGGRLSVLGTKVLLTGHPFEIIGVTPPGFFGVEVGRRFDVAIPLCAEPITRGEETALDKRDFWWLAAIGRLKPGVVLAQADAEMRAISPALFKTTLPTSYAPDDAKNYLAFQLGASPAASGVSALREMYVTPLYLLLAIALLVLLIACANLASLMLARATARDREMAIRLAIGASRGRVIRQMLAESLLIAAIGAAFGGWIAGALSRSLVAFLSTESNQLFVDLETDWRVLVFTGVLAVGTCLIFGLAPALRATRTPPADAMKTSGRGVTDGRERFGVRRGLVVVQVGLSLVLVFGALLFVRTFRNLASLDAGFRPANILVAVLDLRRVTLSAERRRATYEEILDRIRAMPSVTSASQASIVPIAGPIWNDNVTGDALNGPGKKVLANFNRISRGYFNTTGTPFVMGRDFDDHDSIGSPKVAIVNEMFVQKVVERPNPIGQTFWLEERPGEPRVSYQIVGVVGNTKYHELREDFSPIAYIPSSQDSDPWLFSSMLIKSDGPLEDLTSRVSGAVGLVNSGIAIVFQSYPAQLQQSLMRERLMATLAGFFGGLAALLATIGLYGVISYMVTRRRNEIGIRMALGASRSNVVRLIMSEAATLLGVGVTVGVLLALAVGRAATTLLFGVEASDLTTFVLSGLILIATGALASYLPALRAASIQPTSALRQD